MQEYGVSIFKAIATKSALKKSLKKRQITVNGQLATSATMIQGAEKIELRIPDNPSPHKTINLKLDILFEDEHLAIIHKPAGILVSGNSFKTIANALSQNIEPSKLPTACTPQPAHRLDYPTSGALLVGKTRDSIRVLNRQFQNQEIKKTYCAITIGSMSPNGSIREEIDGKESLSVYEVIDSVSSGRFDQLNLVMLKPKTGRRHQLRKHLSSIGNPILGDPEYGIEGLILRGKGLFLHAYSLKFTHPFTQEELHTKDELPKRFKKIFPEAV